MLIEADAVLLNGTLFISQMDQLLWAVDLNLSYSDSVAMAQLMYYTTNGVLDPKTHTFNVPPPKAEKRRRRKWEPESVSTTMIILSNT